MFGAPPNPPAGENVASTGLFVFGRGSAPQGPPGAPPGVNDNLIFWSQRLSEGPTDRSAVLRADFPIVEPISASIVAIATDNDQFLLQAFDAAGNMVAEFDTGQFTNDEMTMNVVIAILPILDY